MFVSIDVSGNLSVRSNKNRVFVSLRKQSDFRRRKATGGKSVCFRRLDLCSHSYELTKYNTVKNNGGGTYALHVFCGAF